ncbi:MAG: hypothetical protein RLZZ591_2614, partial [Pseudomonadota bacterium]
YSYTLTARSTDGAGAETDSFSYTSTDANGNTATNTITITIVDDVPVVTIASTLVTSVVDESGSVGTATITTTSVKGDDPDVTGTGYIGRSVTSGAVVTLSTENYGADDAAASGYKVYALTVSSATSGLTLSDGSTISLVKEGDVVVGMVQGSGSFAGNAAFAIAIDATTGVVTVEQYLSLDHPNEATAANSFNSYDEALSLAAGSLGVTVTLKDGDNDTVTSTSADISGQISFEDDGPAVGTLSVSVAADITHDETSGVQSTSAADDSSATLSGFGSVSGTLIGSAVVASGALLAGSAAYGADGSGSTAVNSYRLTASDGSAFVGVKTNLEATGGNIIFLYTDAPNGLLLGRVGNSDGTANASGAVAFAMKIDANGQVVLAQYLAIDHGNGSGAENASTGVNESLDLTAFDSATELVFVTANATVTDGDGDTATQDLTSASALTVSFLDDGPSVLSKTDLIFSNQGAAPRVGTGTFDFDIGSDQLTSVFRSFQINSATVGSGITTHTLSSTSETADTFTANFSLTYDAGLSTSKTVTGSIVFDKAAGTYTVTMDQALSGYGTLSLGQAISLNEYQLIAGGSPEVAVAELTTGFYAKFTGSSDPGGGAIDIGAGTYSDKTFAAGESFVGVTNPAVVQVSSGEHAGVDGNTMQAGEVLNVDLYASNPHNSTGPIASATLATAVGAYVKLDGFGSTEDLVVVLKLLKYDDATRTSYTTTTKLVVVDSGDVYRSTGAALPADFSTMALDANDALVIINSDDYNIGTDTGWEISGIQILASTEGVTTTPLSAINLNRDGSSALGESLDSTKDSGGGVGTEGTYDGDVFKVSDLGFMVPAIVPQDTSLQFQFNLIDADGDTTSTQTINVKIDGQNQFNGTSAAESITGSASADTISGGGGNDFLDGGLGADTVSYGYATNGVVVDLTAHTGTVDNNDEDDLRNIENVVGSDHNDTLTGDSGANLLSGGAGIDSISGGAGDDILQGGEGGDVLDGGDGSDTASYADATSGVTVDLLGNNFAGAAAGDSYSSIENVLGSAYVDVLIGNAAANTLTGGSGNDTLTGNGGADVFRWQAGDVVDGSTAIDHITDFNGASGGDVIDLRDLVDLPENAASLISRLSFVEVGNKLALQVDVDGTGSTLQQIVFDDSLTISGGTKLGNAMDAFGQELGLSGTGLSTETIIQKMLTDGHLKTDI